MTPHQPNNATSYRAFRLQLVFFSAILTYGILSTTTAFAAGYLGIPWETGFPDIEKKYPSIVFENENAFFLTTFSITPPGKDMNNLELKLFDNRLTAVVQKYSGSLKPIMNENYLRKYLSGLGKRQKVETRKIPTAQGMTDTILWDYGDVLVFFQTYLPRKIKGAPQPSNIIKFVYKPAFNEMMRFIKDNPGGDPNAIEDDFDAIAF